MLHLATLTPPPRLLSCPLGDLRNTGGLRVWSHCRNFASVLPRTTFSPSRSRGPHPCVTSSHDNPVMCVILSGSKLMRDLVSFRPALDRARSLVAKEAYTHSRCLANLAMSGYSAPYAFHHFDMHTSHRLSSSRSLAAQPPIYSMRHLS